MSIIDLNEKYRLRFTENPCEATFEPYVMSELQAPIADYQNALRLFRDYISLIEKPSLLFVAADVCIWWSNEKNVFLEKLKTLLPSLSEYELAIFYYLTAFEEKKSGNETQFKKMLQCSVSLSEREKFAFNRRSLAKVCHGKEAERLRAEALENVVHVYGCEEELDETELLKSEAYVSEFITGTNISAENYETMTE